MSELAQAIDDILSKIAILGFITVIAHLFSLFEPFMSEALAGTEPIFYGHFEHVAQQILKRVGNLLWKGSKVSRLDILNHQAYAFVVVEGRVSDDHLVEDDAEGPDVALLVVLFEEDFGCFVTVSADIGSE